MTVAGARRCFPFRLHSHITITRHPRSLSALMSRSSRAQFEPIFVSQNSCRIWGTLNKWHLWPCQKQPCTSITALYFGSTRSGLPGKSFLCSRNRNPSAWRRLRMNSSGFVFFERIARILRERESGSCTSLTSGSLFKSCKFSFGCHYVRLHQLRDCRKDWHNNGVTKLFVRLRIRDRNSELLAI